MSFNLTVTDGPETKAAKTAWEENDVIYVFFKGLGEKYLKLTYNGSSWDNASGGGTLLDTDFANLSDKTLTAVYYPVPVNVTYVDYEDDTDVFLFDNSDWLVIMNYYLSDAGEAYSVDGTTVTATLSMAKPAGVALFHIAGLTKGIKDYYLSCPLVKPVACVGVRTNGSVWEEEYAEGSNMWGFADADGAIFAGRLMTTEAADYTFKLESPANTYTLSRSNRTLAAGKMYNFPALDDDDWTVTSNIDYVDLGLPSGTLWATVNIGAGSPEEYGDYFAWGETETKTTFGWGNYRHYNYDTGVYTKYSGSDYPILLAEDDAACYNWGGDCRMPTAEDWEELMNNCSLVQTKLGGVDGWQITGNGNSIFLPLGGYHEGSSIGSNGTQGFYWSSSLYTAVASATIMNLTLNNLRMSDLARYMGALVRPVKGGRAIINGHSGIDMGNGVKWATMDLGAGSSVERGDFYAWGETTTKSQFSWSNYSLASIPDSETNPDVNGWRYISKYTFEDGAFYFDFENTPSSWTAAWYNFEIIDNMDGTFSYAWEFTGDNFIDFSYCDYVDDAARNQWGSTWRVPTAMDWQWLIDNCDWQWTSNYNGTQQSGMIVTSKVEGFTTHSIFLPAGGCYWSSEIEQFVRSDYAVMMTFGANGVQFGSSQRYNGYTIRPVSD